MVRHASGHFFEKPNIFKVGIHDASSPPSGAQPQAVGRYHHRTAAALNSSPAIAGVMHAVVEHDGWCAVYNSQRVFF